MYQQERKLQNIPRESLIYQFHEKFIHLVISFSILSIILYHPSWLPFFHSFISQFSTFSSHLCSLATDKKYMFLLCNGILVIIAINSSNLTHTPPHLPDLSPEKESFPEIYRQNIQSSLIEKSVLEENVPEEGEYENITQANGFVPEDDVVDKYVVYQFTNEMITEEVLSEDDNDDYDDDVYKNKDLNGWPFEEQLEEGNEDDKGEVEVEEEEEEALAKMSTEELNRKFDEFIRKMKEEIRIEAQQLIMV